MVWREYASGADGTREVSIQLGTHPPTQKQPQYDVAPRPGNDSRKIQAGGPPCSRELKGVWLQGDFEWRVVRIMLIVSAVHTVHSYVWRGIQRVGGVFLRSGVMELQRSKGGKSIAFLAIGERASLFGPRTEQTQE